MSNTTASKHNRIYAALMLAADLLCIFFLCHGGSAVVLQLTNRIQIAFAIDGLTRCVLPAVTLVLMKMMMKLKEKKIKSK